jgi:hypothetical protein
MPKLIDPELKARAVRLVLAHRGEYPTTTAAIQAVARQVGVGQAARPSALVLLPSRLSVEPQ